MVAPSEDNQQPQQTATAAESAKPAADEASFARLGTDLRNAARELGEYVRYILGVQADRAKFMAMKACGFAVLGFVSLAIAAGLLALGAGLLLVGLAGIIGNAVNSFWVGATIVGAVVVFAPIGGTVVAMQVMQRRMIASLRRKYDARKSQQMQLYGRSVQEVSHG